MKKQSCLLSIALIAVASAALAQNETSAVQSLVNTELAFSKMSEEQGIRPAFMAFIADDGILFRPTAVKGKEWMLAHPVPESTKRPWLSWYPIVAGVSAAGDLGYTTGPWQFKDDIKDTNASGFGNFVTVWKRQPNGTWRFAADLGISNPKPTAVQDPWKAPAAIADPKTATVDVAREKLLLMSLDGDFTGGSGSQLPKYNSFERYYADDVRMYREGKFPFIGKPAVIAELMAENVIFHDKGQPIVWSIKQVDGGVSASGDLAYSYGTYELTSVTSGAKKEIEKGNYLRIWKRDKIADPSAWRVIIDVANPIK